MQCNEHFLVDEHFLKIINIMVNDFHILEDIQ